MDGQPHPETLISLGKSVVVWVPAHLIRPMLTSMPAMAEQLALKLAQKLRQASAQRRILGLTNPVQKVCAQLLVMSQPSLQSHTMHMIPQVPTHQELAIMINASRETVTRVFQLLQTKSMVIRDGNNLILQNVQTLRDVSEGLKTDL
jgi:CRP-like cAMP-binding protein